MSPQLAGHPEPRPPQRRFSRLRRSRRGLAEGVGPGAVGKSLSGADVTWSFPVDCGSGNPVKKQSQPCQVRPQKAMSSGAKAQGVRRDQGAAQPTAQETGHCGRTSPRHRSGVHTLTGRPPSWPGC